MDAGNGLLPRRAVRFHLQLHHHHQMLPSHAPVAVDVGDPQHQIGRPGHEQFAPAGERTQCVMSSEEGGSGQARLQASQLWQRMKWTDDMVRLLIRVVHKVGDDGAGGGAEGERHQHQQAKGHVGKGNKKSASAAAAVLMQKKGKWKTVSAAMMEKGFCVSPQQCDDKFNDLNKRYKRVNELLGRDTACHVVENQALLDSMHGLSLKAKEEVRKLLSSKHLFFPEMCAYHHAALRAADASPLRQHGDQPQSCLYHPPQKALGGGRVEYDHCLAEEMEDDDDDMFSDDDEDYDAYEYEEDDDDSVEERNQKRHRQLGDGHDDADGKECAKRDKSASSSQVSALPLSSGSCSSIQLLRTELMAMSSGGGDEQQQRQWLGRRTAELEEQRVAFQSRALRLERRRFRWLHFSGKKEREMERLKLDNERRRLDNDRMLLMLRQEEFELMHGGASAAAAKQQHSSDAHHASVEA